MAVTATNPTTVTASTTRAYTGAGGWSSSAGSALIGPACRSRRNATRSATYSSPQATSHGAAMYIVNRPKLSPDAL